jgi:ELWxxDGT repeat protein
MASNDERDKELWRSDYTKDGTYPLTNMNKKYDNYSEVHIVYKDELYFSGHEEETGCELWKSDGTPTGTSLFKELVPGSSGGCPQNFVISGDKLFFHTHDALWITDGTEANTYKVKSFTASTPYGGAIWGIVSLEDGRVIFAADDGTHGAEPWVSDGNSSNSYMLKDIYPGDNTSYPTQFTLVDNWVYFSAGDGTNGSELWRTDTQNGGTTELVQDITIGSDFSELKLFTTMDNKLYFVNQKTHDLWSSDPIENNTTKIKNLPAFIRSMQSLSSTLYIGLDNGEGLWKSDGTDAGTIPIKDNL